MEMQKAMSLKEFLQEYGEAFLGFKPIMGAGAEHSFASFGDPSQFLNNDTTSKIRPGTRVLYDDGREFMYVYSKSAGATAPLVGAPAYYVGTTNGYQVSCVMAEGITTKANGVVGVYGNVITDGNYGWIQTKGVFAGLIDSSGAGALDDAIIGAAGGNATARIAAGVALTNKPIGFVTVATAAGKVSAYLVL